jgi:uncharacterized RmlC-like cupin family protein
MSFSADGHRLEFHSESVRGDLFYDGEPRAAKP